MLAKNLRVADKTIGRLISKMVKIKRPRSGSGNQKILVVKLWALGDTVSALPAIKQLKDKYPKSEIHVLCTRWNKPVIDRTKIFDKIWLLELGVKKAATTARLLRKEKFDIVIDFEPFTKTSAVIAYYTGAPVRIGFENRKKLYSHPVKINEKKHIVPIFADLLGALFRPLVPKGLVPLLPSEKAQRWAKGFSMGKKIICMHPGSAGTAKKRRWPVERWAELGNLLEGYSIVVVGSDEEEDLGSRISGKCGAVNLAGKIDIDKLIALCYRSRLFIATDSGPMHISAACGCPTIGLFGPNVPERFGPYCKKCVGIRKAKGPPCILPFQAKFKCEHNHIEKISVQDVFSVAKRLLR